MTSCRFSWGLEPGWWLAGFLICKSYHQKYHRLRLFEISSLLSNAIAPVHALARLLTPSIPRSLAECTGVIMPVIVSSIVEGDMALLSRLLCAGVDPNLAGELCGQEQAWKRINAHPHISYPADHNQSTLLHMAAAEGSMAAVKLLLEAGADPLLDDRWGDTACDDARCE